MNTFGARCPNHRVLLLDCEIDGGGHGTGICPISGCTFTFDADHAEKTKKLRLNAMGQYEEIGDWKVVQVDGEGG